MKVTQVKVKTFYDVELTTKDIVKVIKEYADKESLRVCYSSPVFDGLDGDTVTIGELHDIMKNGLFRATGNVYTLIAKVHGFDGWYNAGFYDERKGVYCMQVYNNGDTLGMPI